MNFNHKQDYLLEDERVLLRPMLKEDFKHLLPFSITEPEIWTYSLIPANGEKNLMTYMQYALNERDNGSSYPFVVYDKLAKSYAGTSRFYDIQPKHNTVQLGYTWYGKEFQGTGLNKHCKFLMLKFAFETLSVERVEFRADAKNKRSIAAMKSIGCTVEGILRSNCAAVNGRRDSIVLSILKNEWFDKVKDQLREKIK